MSPQEFLDLGIAHHTDGRLAEAEAIYRQILATHPNNPDVLHLLGVLAHHAGNAPAGVAIIQEAIAANPTNPLYYNNLSQVLFDLGQLEAAEQACVAALRLKPDFASAHYNRGIALAALGRANDAIAAYEAALQHEPGFGLAALNLGNLLLAQRRNEDCIAMLRTALTVIPHDAALQNHLGVALRDSGRNDEALEVLREAVRLQPNLAVAQNNLANVYSDQGRIAEALACYRRSLDANPADRGVHSSLLFTSYLDPAADTASIAAEHARWSRRFADPLRAEWRPHDLDRSPERRLRIGYLSGDFRQHASAHFVLPLLEAHDHAAFEVHAYANLPSGLPLTERFRRSMDQWHDVVALSDAALAEKIRADRIDILVDLTMHALHDRLLVFARRPAPVQVAWMGHPGSTGLEAIGHRFTDAQLEPPGCTDTYSAEEPIRLPDTWCCYDPLGESPEPGDLPAARGEPFTFGSMNGFKKLNAQVLDLWARVLTATPGSRLRILAKPGSHRDRTLEIFAAHGVAPDRVQFQNHAPRLDYLRLFHEIDLALDPFPYNGHTTTCDALWMGVPVLTLAGKMAPARISSSLLANVGLAELAVETEADYVRLAAELTRDLPRLQSLRAGLRQRMQASPLMDGPRFALHVEAAYRDLWRRWCTA